MDGLLLVSEYTQIISQNCFNQYVLVAEKLCDCVKMETSL
jgi:hypothetical protein